jgi:hypothetical protein
MPRTLIKGTPRAISGMRLDPSIMSRPGSQDAELSNTIVRSSASTHDLDTSRVLGSIKARSTDAEGILPLRT